MATRNPAWTHGSWGNGSWNPIIYKVLAPSKRWLTLGFLNHQPEWSLLSCVISINRKQSHRTDWVNEISSWWEIMMDPCWYSDDTDWIHLPNPGCQWQMKVYSRIPDPNNGKFHPDGDSCWVRCRLLCGLQISWQRVDIFSFILPGFRVFKLISSSQSTTQLFF